MAGSTVPSRHEQQLLALDAQSNYAVGGWNSSLEYTPTWRCLPAGLRGTWEHREGRSLSRTLLLTDLAQLRADIDARHHVAGLRDLELAVAGLPSIGGVSPRFSQVLAEEGVDRALARLSSLTGCDEWELRDLGVSQASRPPELLRGGKVQWAVSLTRRCYTAEQVDAETA